MLYIYIYIRDILNIKNYKNCKNVCQIPRYQNTYRLEPYKTFKYETVDLILMDVMRNYLTGLKYQPQTCMRICQKMSTEVRDRICRKYYDR